MEQFESHQTVSETDPAQSAAVVPRIPGFARRIIEKYESAQSNVFLVHGNTRDVYPIGPGEYVPLTEFFVKALIKPNRSTGPRIVVVYDPADGIAFWNPMDRRLVANVLGEERLRRVLSAARRDVVTAISALREFVNLRITVPFSEDPDRRIRKDFAIIIRHGEMVAPASRGDSMLDSERLKVITLENWFSDNTFVSSPDIVFMVSETLTGVNERVVELPYTASIAVDRPDEEERLSYIRHVVEGEKIECSVPIRSLAYNSAGLSLLALRQIFLQASYKGDDVTPELIFEKTKESIEKELEGYIEFPRLSYGFEKVIGASALIKKLNELNACLQGDDPDLMPVGVLVPGANGVGKTFIYKAFAKECGWVAVVLKNIRGQYVGQTERNWERIRSVLESMSSVMVMYDEADTEIGGRSAQTHDVDRRLFGNILRMMSDPHNKGRIVWIIITARPDRLEPDIKRSGRAGEHLPVFDNEGADKEAFIAHVMSRIGFDTSSLSPEQHAEFLEFTKNYYPADFDQIITELKRRRYIDGELTPDAVLEEVKDFIPSDIARQREYQELLAFMECTSRELIPERYAHLSRERVREMLREIQMGGPA